VNNEDRSHPAPTPIRATVVTGRWPTIPARETRETPPGKFPPTTATLISGATEVVLIDTLYLKDDVRDLGDLIERTGKRLTTIYITHDHADHYFGSGPLLDRFPDAKCVALPHVVDSIVSTMEAQKQQWDMFFGDATVQPGPPPEPLEGDVIYVDGSPINVIEVAQADIHPSSVVHIPAIDTVVAGDAIYNEIFPMLALSTPDEWLQWLQTVDLIESLKPRMIVGGHRRPDSDDYAVDAMISQTRNYIRDFAQASATAKGVEELVEMMAVRHPHYTNMWSLVASAASALQRRESTQGS